MTRILIYEPSFRRIQARLPASAAQATFLLMDENGEVRLDGNLVDRAEIRAEVGWMSGELAESSAFGHFLRHLQSSPKLAWVQSVAAGFEHSIFADIVRTGARLTTNHAQGVAIAEYVLWGVLDIFQRGPERRAAQAGKTWVRLPFPEVLGSHWLIVGFGSIGQAVAERARGFGARITGARRSAGEHALADAMVKPDALPEVLPQADVVVLSLPGGVRTKGMADAAFFARMKPGSVIVNVGRGSLLDEDALVAALDRGAPAHALLDVFQTEPLPAESPLWSHPKVTLTGHASPMGSGLSDRTDELFLDNLDRFLTGQPLLNEASPEEVLAG